MGFTVFDIETRIDKQLVNRVFFAREGLSDEQAYQRFRDDLQGRGSDFFPLTLHVPISIAIGDVGDDYVLHSVQSLAVREYSEETLVRRFWDRVESFSGCLVSFNGRRFDLPVLEMAALRWGIAAPSYFGDGDSFRKPRSERHLDLCDYLTNYGEVGLRGGMDLLLKMVGLPGKLTLKGANVQEYFDSGRLQEIHHYCRSDVIQTYFLLLRVDLMRGRLGHAGYLRAVSAAAPFLDRLRADADHA